MSDNNPNEGGTSQNGAAPQPAGGVSGNEGKPFEGASDLKKLLEEAIDAKLKPVLSEVRGVQGKADKNAKEFQEFFKSYQAKLQAGATENEAYAAVTSEREEAERKRRREEALDKLLESQGLLSGNAVGNSISGTVRVAKELAAKYELDPDDPEVGRIVSSRKAEELEDALGFYAFKKSKQPPASPAGVPAMQTTPVSSPNEEAIAREIEQLAKEPSKNYKRMQELKQQLK